MRALEYVKAAWEKKWVKVIAIVSSALLVIIFSALGIDYLYYSSKIYPNVKMDSHDLGKLTFTEAEEYLADTLWSMELINLNLEGDKQELLLGVAGVNYDKEATLHALFSAGRGWGGYKERLNSLFRSEPIFVQGVLTVDEVKLAEVMTDLAALVYISPEDASFEVSGADVSISHEKEGRYLQVGAMREAILQCVKKGIDETAVPVGKWPAARTSSDLEEYGVNQVMASYYTDVAAGNSDRAHNIKLGSAALNGILLAPGDILSFNNTVGRTTVEKGYRYAPIIVGDQLVPGLGGGLCQVSSTLYNAALMANLEIVERHNHTMRISYLPLGRDATVAIGSLDLRIRNNRDHYVLIGSELKNLRLTFRVFGLPMEEKVEIQTSGQSQVAPPVRYENNNALPAGTTELKKAGTPGYYVTTWRVVYINGKEISREQLARDYYQPTAAVYYRGTGNTANNN